MTFQQALSDHPAPSGVGDVALYYQPSMLVGESVPLGGRWRATITSGAGLALISCSVFLLLQPPNPILFGAAALNAALAGALLWLARRLDCRSRTRRRFLLLFQTEELQLELPAFKGLGVRVHRLPFDAVRRVEVEEHTLIIGWEQNGSHSAVLIDDVVESEFEALYRLRRTLGAAFGLKKDF